MSDWQAWFEVGQSTSILTWTSLSQAWSRPNTPYQTVLRWTMSERLSLQLSDLVIFLVSKFLSSTQRKTATSPQQQGPSLEC